MKRGLLCIFLLVVCACFGESVELYPKELVFNLPEEGGFSRTISLREITEGETVEIQISPEIEDIIRITQLSFSEFEVHVLPRTSLRPGTYSGDIMIHVVRQSQVPLPSSYAFVDLPIHATIHVREYTPGIGAALKNEIVSSTQPFIDHLAFTLMFITFIAAVMISSYLRMHAHNQET